MSADNTIVILKTVTNPALLGNSRQVQARDGSEYRVAHVQNVEDIRTDDHEPNWNYIHSYFDKCRVFNSRDQALGYALRLEEEIGFVEYGICDEEFDEVYPPIIEDEDEQNPVFIRNVNDNSGTRIPLKDCYIDNDWSGETVKVEYLLRDDWREILEDAAEVENLCNNKAQIQAKGLSKGRPLVDCPSCDGGKEYPFHNCEGCCGEGKVDVARTSKGEYGRRFFKDGQGDLRILLKEKSNESR